jgi:hypothetical protein
MRAFLFGVAAAVVVAIVAVYALDSFQAAVNMASTPSVRL